MRYKLCRAFTLDALASRAVAFHPLVNRLSKPAYVIIAWFTWAAGEYVSWDFQVRILHSAEEDNLSRLDTNIACLCQSIEINNNNHSLVYVTTVWVQFSSSGFPIHIDPFTVSSHRSRGIHVDVFTVPSHSSSDIKDLNYWPCAMGIHRSCVSLHKCGKDFDSVT